MKPGGWLLFTAERVSGEGYALGAKRRYGHSEDYVRLAAQRSGLEVMALLECTPRLEAHAPVDGLAVALQRSP